MKPETKVSREAVRLSVGVNNKMAEILHSVQIIHVAVNALQGAR
jgi:hypothetical protein